MTRGAITGTTADGVYSQTEHGINVVVVDGAGVVGATNGVEALEHLNETEFDVVLMDAQMPVMDGLTATQMLRAGQSPNRMVPVVALTANARAEDRNACLEAGMTDFVSKPISAEALMGALVRAANYNAANQTAAE